MNINSRLKSQLDVMQGASFAIEVNVELQQCYLFDQAGKLKKTYLISSGVKGISEVENSGGTPSGLHVISDCIGDGEPLGMCFRGRVAQHEIIHIIKETPDVDPSGDYILTRIFRLRGLEQGLNLGQGVDSFERYIYFHGTNEEYLIGTPASHGCIRMRNEDIVELFSTVKEGTPVFIG